MNTRRLSWIITISSTILFVVLLVFFYKNPLSNPFSSILITVGIFIAFNYFIIRYWIRKDIYEKIRTIYKNIYSFKVSKIDLKQKVKSSIISLDQVKEEVDEWVEKSNKHITEMIALEKFRKEYIGNVAHELKTPIFNIQGYVSTLLDGAMEDEDLKKKYLLRAEAGIDRLITIVQDLDTIAELELNELPLTITKFDIIALMRDIIDSFELKSARNQISILLQQRDVLIVEADKSKIRQVVVNLIDNAIKYSKEGRGEVRIKVFDMHTQLLIEVSDHGIGIDEKDINRVFERFYRTDKARSRESGGSGLGLAIVKHIIEAHNQTINVRSKIGEGTVFGFTLQKAV